MSYDLVLSRRDGEDWDDALEAAELVEDYGGPWPAEKWSKVMELARTHLPHCRDISTAEQSALEDDDAGIELTATLVEDRMGVPYRHRGNDAAHVIRTMYLIGELISELSGLEGYDQQTGLPAVMENVDDAISVYDGTPRTID